MALSHLQIDEVAVLEVGAGTRAADVDAAIASESLAWPVPALVLDITRLRSADELAPLIREWAADQLAFVTRDDTLADGLEHMTKSLLLRPRICASIDEALRWFRRQRVVSNPPHSNAAPASQPAPSLPISPGRWLPYSYSLELLESAVALLRAIHNQDPNVCQVRAAASPPHVDAFVRHAGLLPRDVGRVLGLTTEFSSYGAKLCLDFLRCPPDRIGPTGELLLVNGESEGLCLEVLPDACRLWWLTHDGSPTLVDRGLDAWVIHCAGVARDNLERRFALETRLRLGLPISTPTECSPRAAEHTLLPSTVVDVCATVEGGSLEAAWLRSLPEDSPVYDFRQAAPRTRIAEWPDGDWTHCGELWALV